MQKLYVVIPNWNGAGVIRACLDSLANQTEKVSVIVVDNGSTDKSVEIIEAEYPDISLLKHSRNLGFSGGVNAGIKYALGLGAEYIALLNNDAVADSDWAKELSVVLDRNPKVGIAASKMIDAKAKTLDSTGEFYTIWGLPFPRGRGDSIDDQNENELIFGASGGASMYRSKMLRHIGLFDNDFFAYYEDVDLSFRAQLAGWMVAYTPKAVVRHKIGSTSGTIGGFVTYQTLKNLPMLMWKNVPWALMPKVWPRLTLAYLAICGRALQRGQFGPFFKGTLVGTLLLPKKLFQRHKIQNNRRVSPEYIDSILVHDLPPDAQSLRTLRAKWWRLRGKS